MTPVLVPRDHAIEQERIDVVVERLVVEEAFREQRQVPTPRPLSPPVNLEKADLFVPVNLVARRMPELTFRQVSFEHERSGVKGEAVLANVENVDMGVFDRVRGKVPGFDAVFPHLDGLQVLDPGDFRVLLRHRTRGSETSDLVVLG